MSDFWSSLGSAVLGGLDAGSKVFNALSQKDTADKNLELQKETNAQNLALQQQAWVREDSAVQRRAADMKAAGINPLLAAGSPAASMAPIHLAAPQRGMQTGVPQGLGSDLLDMVRGAFQIAQTGAQTALTNQQVQSAQLANTYANRTMDARVYGVDLANQSQYLANEFAGSANPLKLTGMELQNNFDTAANPVRLQQLAVALKGADISNVNAELDSKLKDLGIQQSQLDIVRAKYANSQAFEQLNLLQKESLIKALTIDALTMNNQQLREQTGLGAGFAGGVKSWLGVLAPLVEFSAPYAR